MIRPRSLVHYLTVSASAWPDGDWATAEVALADVTKTPDRLRVTAALDTAGACGGQAPALLQATERTGGLALDLCAADWTVGLGILPLRLDWSLRTAQTAYPPTSAPDVFAAGDDRQRRPLAHVWDGQRRITLDDPAPPLRRLSVSYSHAVCSLTSP